MCPFSKIAKSSKSLHPNLHGPARRQALAAAAVDAVVFAVVGGSVRQHAVKQRVLGADHTFWVGRRWREGAVRTLGARILKDRLQLRLLLVAGQA